MTSLNLEYRLKEHENRMEFWMEFCNFCKENNVQSLFSFLIEHKLEIQDLIAQNLMKYDNESAKMTGMSHFSKPVLTGCSTNILETYQGKGEFNSFNEYYVINKNKLVTLLQPQLNKSALERREDYKAAYLAQHGLPAEPTDDELPFESKSYIQGPYCHLDSFIKENSPVSCDWCGTCLNGRPQLLIADQTVCYSCHYIALEHITPSISVRTSIVDDIYEKSIKDYNAQLAQWELEKAKAESRLSWFEKLFNNTNIYLDEFLENTPKPSKVDLKASEEQKLVGYILFINKCDDNRPYSRVPILRRDKHTCQMCGFQENERIDVKLEVHHIWPRAKGHLEHCSNLITLCEPCHNEEKRFDHFRVKPRISVSSFPNKWNWEITPTLLTMTIEEIAKRDDWFGKPRTVER